MGDPLILMKGLYPRPATEPGCTVVAGSVVGPGTSTRRGEKSGAPAKCTVASPNFRSGAEVWVTVWTQAAHPMPRLVSLAE